MAINRSQWESQRRQAINKYNQAVRKFNQDQQRRVDTINREIKRQVDNYNREVRNYNSKVRSNRQTLNNAIAQFNSSSNRTIIYTTHVSYELRQSTELLSNSFNILESSADEYYSGNQARLLVDFPEQETSNSLRLYNSLSGVSDEHEDTSDMQKTFLEEQLSKISDDLDSRWRGALYSLNPDNPDATRHFCTSVREIFIKILEIKASDYEVLRFSPNCELYEGKPSRRSKITYLLSKKSILNTRFNNFVNCDIDDLMSLFRTLNDGTHGSAGRLNIQQLLKLKNRVENSILFVSNIAG